MRHVPGFDQGWRGYNLHKTKTKKRHWIPDWILDYRGEACGVSAPHDEVLLFRQKDPKPWAPGRGPRGVPLPQSRLLDE